MILGLDKKTGHMLPVFAMSVLGASFTEVWVGLSMTHTEEPYIAIFWPQGIWGVRCRSLWPGALWKVSTERCRDLRKRKLQLASKLL